MRYPSSEAHVVHVLVVETLSYQLLLEPFLPALHETDELGECLVPKVERERFLSLPQLYAPFPLSLAVLSEL